MEFSDQEKWCISRHSHFLEIWIFDTIYLQSTLDLTTFHGAKRKCCYIRCVAKSEVGWLTGDLSRQAKSVVKSNLLLNPMSLYPMLTVHNCAELWQHWRTKVRHSAHLFCTSIIPPQQTTPNTGPDLNRPWMTKDVLPQIKHKHCLFRQHTKTKSQADWKAFTTQRDRTCTIIRNAKTSVISRKRRFFSPLSSIFR